MYIYIAQLDDCLCNMTANVFNIVSNSTKKYINKKIHEKDRYRTIIAEVLLKMIFLDKLNLSKVTFDRTCFGLLCNDNEKYHFSISHSQNYIIVVASEYKVGIDIQYMDYKMLKIAKRFFFAEEINYIYQFEKPIIERFYEVWTKKESCYKYNNHKLGYSFLGINTMDNKKCPGKYNTVVFRDEYMLTICSSKIIENLEECIFIIPSFAINDFINKNKG